MRALPVDVERFLARADRAALVGLLVVVSARLLEPEPKPAPAAADRWISMRAAAGITGLSRSYLYEHARELPFATKRGRRVLMFEPGLRAWLAEREA